MALAISDGNWAQPQTGADPRTSQAAAAGGNQFAGHLPRPLVPAIEGMESCDFRQLTQASVRHSELQATASATGKYPLVRETMYIGGLKTEAPSSNAAVVV
jgi:hypothetical protein